MQAASEPAYDYDPVRVHSIVEQEGPSRFFVNGVGDVNAGRQYIAASGRICRTLNTLDGEALLLRSCQADTGQWYTTRSLSAPQPLRAPFLKSDQDI